jgi:hypothetical protein
LGLLSRKNSGIPFFVGDILYAVLIYLLFRGIGIFKSEIKTFFLSLLCCFFIEFSQLLDWELLLQMRATTLGKLVLGQGFLWSDLVAYSAGTGLGFLWDIFLRERFSNFRK